MTSFFCSVLVLAAALGVALSLDQYSKQPAIVFATVELGRTLLTAHDDFVARLSPFDRSARLKTDQEVSEGEYLAFLSGSVLPWSAVERNLVRRTWDQLAPRLSALQVSLPQTIYLVKTSGREEGNGEYTRGRSIILPASALVISKQRALIGTIAHELFHILSRNSPALSSRFYQLIGFLPCQELSFPTELVKRKITSPDAPRNNHYIRLRYRESDVLAIPILFSNSLQYNVTEGGEFFKYMTLQFLLVHKEGSAGLPRLTYDQKHPAIIPLEQLSGFYDQVGRNTNYIIHPEEILADNFEFWLLGKPDLPSPQILKQFSSVLLKTPRK